MSNKIFIVACLCLLFSTKSFAQKKIEKLNTDEDVLKFVRNFFISGDNPDYSWKNFEFVDGNEWRGLYNINKRVEDSLSLIPVSKWKKADFNFDNRQDLIVSGKKILGNNVSYFILLFLSNEQGDYQVISVVPEEYENYPYYFSILTLPKIEVPGIRIVKWFPEINNESNNGLPFTVDTLGFAKEYLVNYNAHPDSALFKKVKFESMDLDGSRTVVEINDLDKGKTSPIIITKYKTSKDSSVVHGKITMDYYAQLLATINYSGFKELPHQFQSNFNAPQTFILDVYYEDGSHKRVEDFSGGGTYTLSAIYNWYADILNQLNASIQKRRNEWADLSGLID